MPFGKAFTMTSPESDFSTDEKILRQLNDDGARYAEFLAEDFTATLPDLVFRNRQAPAAACLERWQAWASSTTLRRERT
jgi:hypothetical protein